MSQKVEQRAPRVAAAQAHGPAAAITRRAADRLRAGHLWVYRSDIESLIPLTGATEIPGGSLVTVTDSRGIPLGTAIYSAASQIALRLVSSQAALPRAAYLEQVRDRVRAALDLRDQLAPESSDNNACRLLFSEADALPGIVADRYNDLVILQLLTQATAQDDVRRAVTEAIAHRLQSQPGGLSGRLTLWERPDPRMRELEQLPAPSPEPLYSAAELPTELASIFPAEPPAELPIEPPAEPRHPPSPATIFTINGLRFHFDAASGQKTGAFLDQRLNYAAAAAYASGDALDICTYQGGFALHMAERCRRVTGVDASRAALEVADRNLTLNLARKPGLAAHVDWIEADAFELLRDHEAAGRHYDTIVLDPPAFAKSSRAAESAMRGYKELNLRAIKMLRPGGALITCSCSHHVSLPDFTSVLADAASDAARRVQLLEVRGAAPDHPAILTLPETAYLKCLICRIA